MEVIGFTLVLRENFVLTQVNATKDFEVLKLVGTTEWE